jgi:hypothetical protein
MRLNAGCEVKRSARHPIRQSAIDGARLYLPLDGRGAPGVGLI